MCYVLVNPTITIKSILYMLAKRNYQLYSVIAAKEKLIALQIKRYCRTFNLLKAKKQLNNLKLQHWRKKYVKQSSYCILCSIVLSTLIIRHVKGWWSSLLFIDLYLFWVWKLRKNMSVYKHMFIHLFLSKLHICTCYSHVFTIFTILMFLLKNNLCSPRLTCPLLGERDIHMHWNAWKDTHCSSCNLKRLNLRFNHHN